MTEALPAAVSTVPWWIWPIALFAVTFLLGIVAVIAGVGGGVLFVPIVGSFFPFHLDFVRGAGLLLALAGTLSAGPTLLRSGFASLRLAMPLALAGNPGLTAYEYATRWDGHLPNYMGSNLPMMMMPSK